MNYREFFTLEKTHTHTSDSPDTFSFTWSKVVSCRPTTSYDVVNVQIHVEDVGTIVVSGSGTGSVTRPKTIFSSDYETQKSYITAIGLERLAMAYDSVTPTVDSASGTMRMSWHEAEAILAGYYEKAEAYLADDRADLAVKWFDLLSRVEYRDSADRKAAVVQQVRAAHYAKGEAMLAAGNHTGAITAFTQAGNHSDAAAKLKAAHYARGEALLAEGSHSAAIDAFKAAGDHQDAADRIKAIAAAQAEALLSLCDYAGAAQILEAAGDSAAAARVRTEGQYVQATALIAAGQLEEAMKVLAYMGADERAVTLRGQAVYLYGATQENASNRLQWIEYSGYADAQEKVWDNNLGYYEAAVAAGYVPALEYRYNWGKKYFDQGDYGYAYSQLLEVRGYKDAEALLADKAMKDALRDYLKLSGTLGDIITFGSWAPVGGNGTKQPIEWLIVDNRNRIDKKDPTITLVSRYVLDVQPFDRDSDKEKWDKSDLCSWLNGTFLKTAFTQAEQNALVAADGKKVSIPYRYNYFTEGGITAKNPLFTSGKTAAGEAMSYWTQRGKLVNGEGKSASAGSYSEACGVRPVITIRLNAGGLNWQNYTCTLSTDYNLDMSPYGQVLMLMKNGRYAEALQVLRDNNDLDYNYVNCALHLAYEAYVQGDPDAAIAYLTDKTVRAEERSKFGYYSTRYRLLAEALGLQ